MSVLPLGTKDHKARKHGYNFLKKLRKGSYTIGEQCKAGPQCGHLVCRKSRELQQAVEYTERAIYYEQQG